MRSLSELRRKINDIQKKAKELDAKRAREQIPLSKTQRATPVPKEEKSDEATPEQTGASPMEEIGKRRFEFDSILRDLSSLADKEKSRIYEVRQKELAVQWRDEDARDEKEEEEEEQERLRKREEAKAEKAKARAAAEQEKKEREEKEKAEEQAQEQAEGKQGQGQGQEGLDPLAQLRMLGVDEDPDFLKVLAASQRTLSDDFVRGLTYIDVMTNPKFVIEPKDMFPPVPTGDDRSSLTKFIDLFVDVTNQRIEALNELRAMMHPYRFPKKRTDLMTPEELELYEDAHRAHVLEEEFEILNDIEDLLYTFIDENKPSDPFWENCKQYRQFYFLPVRRRLTVSQDAFLALGVKMKQWQAEEEEQLRLEAEQKALTDGTPETQEEVVEVEENKKDEKEASDAEGKGDAENDVLGKKEEPKEEVFPVQYSEAIIAKINAFLEDYEREKTVTPQFDWLPPKENEMRARENRLLRRLNSDFNNIDYPKLSRSLYQIIEDKNEVLELSKEEQRKIALEQRNQLTIDDMVHAVTIPDHTNIDVLEFFDDVRKGYIQIDESLTLDITKPTARELFMKSVMIPFLRTISGAYRKYVENEVRKFDKRYETIRQLLGDRIPPEMLKRMARDQEAVHRDYADVLPLLQEEEDELLFVEDFETELRKKTRLWAYMKQITYSNILYALMKRFSLIGERTNNEATEAGRSAREYLINEHWDFDGPVSGVGDVIEQGFIEDVSRRFMYYKRDKDRVLETADELKWETKRNFDNHLDTLDSFRYEEDIFTGEKKMFLKETEPVLPAMFNAIDQYPVDGSTLSKWSHEWEKFKMVTRPMSPFNIFGPAPVYRTHAEELRILQEKEIERQIEQDLVLARLKTKMVDHQARIKLAHRDATYKYHLENVANELPAEIVDSFEAENKAMLDQFAVIEDDLGEEKDDKGYSPQGDPDETAAQLKIHRQLEKEAAEKKKRLQAAKEASEAAGIPWVEPVDKVKKKRKVTEKKKTKKQVLKKRQSRRGLEPETPSIVVDEEIIPEEVPPNMQQPIEEAEQAVDQPPKKTRVIVEKIPAKTRAPKKKEPFLRYLTMDQYEELEKKGGLQVQIMKRRNKRRGIHRKRSAEDVGDGKALVISDLRGQEEDEKMREETIDPYGPRISTSSGDFNNSVGGRMGVMGSALFNMFTGANKVSYAKVNALEVFKKNIFAFDLKKFRANLAFPMKELALGYMLGQMEKLDKLPTHYTEKAMRNRFLREANSTGIRFDILSYLKPSIKAAYLSEDGSSATLVFRMRFTSFFYEYDINTMEVYHGYEQQKKAFGTVTLAVTSTPQGLEFTDKFTFKKDKENLRRCFDVNLPAKRIADLERKKKFAEIDVEQDYLDPQEDGEEEQIETEEEIARHFREHTNEEAAGEEAEGKKKQTRSPEDQDKANRE